MIDPLSQLSQLTQLSQFPQLSQPLTNNITQWLHSGLAISNISYKNQVILIDLFWSVHRGQFDRE